MGHKAVSIAMFSCLLALFFLFLPGRIIAQEQGPVFWTQGGNWGNWLRITGHPGLAIRTACGDNTTLRNYPVSSTDWELRNSYAVPMSIVWRADYFAVDFGKSQMGGWVLEHLKPGEVSNGWAVEAGHCKAINKISVQVRCAVPQVDEAKCYDENGSPYPLRPDDAFRGDHNPTSDSQAGAASSQTEPSYTTQARSMYCIGASRINQVFMTQPFITNESNASLDSAFKAWVVHEHPELGNEEEVGAECFPGTETTIDSVAKLEQQSHLTVTMVTWSPQPNLTQSDLPPAAMGTVYVLCSGWTSSAEFQDPDRNGGHYSGPPAYYGKTKIIQMSLPEDSQARGEIIRTIGKRFADYLSVKYSVEPVIRSWDRAALWHGPECIAYDSREAASEVTNGRLKTYSEFDWAPNR